MRRRWWWWRTRSAATCCALRSRLVFAIKRREAMWLWLLVFNAKCKLPSSAWSEGRFLTCGTRSACGVEFISLDCHGSVVINHQRLNFRSLDVSIADALLNFQLIFTAHFINIFSLRAWALGKLHSKWLSRLVIVLVYTSGRPHIGFAAKTVEGLQVFA